VAAQTFQEAAGRARGETAVLSLFFQLILSKGAQDVSRKRTKSAPPESPEVRQVSPELQAGIDRFAKALGHLILVKINPEAARQMAEDQV
jgi:hypothetical protein